MINYIIFLSITFFCSLIMSGRNDLMLKKEDYNRELSKEVITDIQKNKYCDMISFLDFFVLKNDSFEDDAKEEYEKLSIHRRINPADHKQSYEDWKKYYCDTRERHRVQGAFTAFVVMTTFLMGSWYWGY